MNKMRGFTLLELVIILVIASILAAWGLPGLSNLTANSRMMTAANSLVASFQKARSLAITRSTKITIEATDNVNWANGWQIVDKNTGTVLDTHEGMGLNVTIKSAGAVSYAYTSQGHLDIVANDAIVMCDKRTGADVGRTLTLVPIGRVTVTSSACP